MIYSDQDILHSLEDDDGIRIHPFNSRSLGPASYDLHLGTVFWTYKELPYTTRIDPLGDVKPLMQREECSAIIMKPHQFALGSTMERVRIPEWVTGRLDGKSSIGRLGMMIHVTAGNIDPGNELNITLELSNQSPYEIILYGGMPIAQLVFTEVMTRPTTSYPERKSSKYYGSVEAEPSKIHLNCSCTWRTGVPCPVCRARALRVASE